MWSSTPSPTRLRRPARPPKNKKTSAACSRTSCRRWESATPIPANTDKRVPVICFCSHMDTSPDCTGKDVKPQIVRNYRGGDIVLPADPAQVIRAADHPALGHQIGNDIITTDGTTLL